MGKHPCIRGILLRTLICTTAFMAISATACAAGAWTELNDISCPSLDAKLKCHLA